MMLDLNAVLGKPRVTQLMRGLVRGQYHALLGAGASFGGVSSDGRTLPGGVALAEELRDEFDVPAGPANLMRVHEAARSRTTSSGQTLPDYIMSRFTSTQPPAWMKHMTEIHWAGLWTLNIDDCLERCYFQNSEQARQNPVSISWTDKHRTARTAASEVLLVHLHGKASRAAREGELIFDMSGYLNATVAQHRWHRIFGDYYPTAPFLIVGASLDNEFDLHGILSQGHLKGGDFPSLVVLKDIDDLSADEYRRFGLLPVKATAEEFFEAIRGLLPEYLEELTAGEAKSLEETATEAVQFLQQWQRLSRDQTPKRDRRHDFYSGHEPEWVDILDDLPSHRDALASVLRRVRDQAAGSSVAHVVAGDAFSGKSTLVLDLARQLDAAGFTPYLFDSDVAPDLTAVVWWLRRHPRTVLLIDDGEDFAKDVAELLRQSSDDPLTIRVVLAERANRAAHIRSQLITLPTTETDLKGRLSRREVDALLNKLQGQRRLGVLTSARKSDRHAFFDQRGGELFSSMAELERGRGFVSRVKDEYFALSSASGQALVRAVGVASKLGYGLPTKLVKAVCGIAPAELETLLATDEVADFVVRRRSTIAPRHRYFGALVFDECLSQQERFDDSERLALGLAPHLSPSAIAASTLEYRMARGLMAANFVARITGNTEAALRWYDDLETSYDWNARYWEQRALTAAEARRFEPAYSWAQEAVSRRKDAFTLNTLGVVLMRRALFEARKNSWPAESFEEAEESLAQARDLEGSQAEYPFDTFFNYTLRLLEAVPERDSAINEQVRNLWMNWQLGLLRLESTTRERLQATVDLVNARWNELGL